MVSQQQAEQDAEFAAQEYTLFDKIMYGGFGYGEYCFPSQMFRYIVTIIFPPIGVFLKHVTSNFPYINFKGIITGLDEIIYCTVLTMCFYVPGLIYALSALECDENN